jgi:hypothetical protein
MPRHRGPRVMGGAAADAIDPEAESKCNLDSATRENGKHSPLLRCPERPLSDFFAQNLGEVTNERQQYPQVVVQGPNQEGCCCSDDNPEEFHSK